MAYLTGSRFQNALRNRVGRQPDVTASSRWLLMAVLASLTQKAEPPPEHDFRIISCNFSGAVPLTPKQLREQRGVETLRVGLVMLLRSYVESRNEEIDLDVVAHALDIAETGTGEEAFDAAIRRLCVKRPAVLAESTVREVAEQLHKLIKARPTSSLPRPSVRRRELLDDKADISKFGYKVRGDRTTIERNGVPYRLTASKAVKESPETGPSSSLPPAAGARPQ